MKINLFPIFGLLSVIALISPVRLAAGQLPDGFVYLEDIAPGITVELRYCTEDNFIGKRIDGYLEPVCILTRQAAEAMKKVQADLKRFGFGLKIFDAYRPQQAVDHFVRWSKDLNDTKMKSRYYPATAKKDLFKKGYIARRSGHSRGSTLDLTIVEFDSKGNARELDMGTPFDFLDPKSRSREPSMNACQRANRMLLQITIKKHGFRPYFKEWWHFTLENEPFPGIYFNFSVQ